MDYQDILYDVEGPVATITMNRPHYRNAQTWRLLDELDAAFDRAMEDGAVRAVIVHGAGGNFSSGHDLGTPDFLVERELSGIEPNTLADYDTFRKYNLDLLLKWRDLPKPTIAMVEGYCIFAGWMIVAATDVVFASEDALFLAGFHEYFSVPWDIHPRKAKEILFESRFIGAVEAMDAGLVNRVCSPQRLEAEAVGFARRVAENNPMWLRMLKASVNQSMDMQGYSVAMQTAFSDFIAQVHYGGMTRADDGSARLGPVDLALRGLRGERPGLEQPGG